MLRKISGFDVYHFEDSPYVSISLPDTQAHIPCIYFSLTKEGLTRFIDLFSDAQPFSYELMEMQHVCIRFKKPSNKQINQLFRKLSSLDPNIDHVKEDVKNRLRIEKPEALQQRILSLFMTQKIAAGMGQLLMAYEDDYKEIALESLRCVLEERLVDSLWELYYWAFVQKDFPDEMAMILARQADWNAMIVTTLKRENKQIVEANKQLRQEVKTLHAVSQSHGAFSYLFSIWDYMKHLKPSFSLGFFSQPVASPSSTNVSDTNQHRQSM